MAAATGPGCSTLVGKHDRVSRNDVNCRRRRSCAYDGRRGLQACVPIHARRDRRGAGSVSVGHSKAGRGRTRASSERPRRGYRDSRRRPCGCAWPTSCGPSHWCHRPRRRWWADACGDGPGPRAWWASKTWPPPPVEKIETERLGNLHRIGERWACLPRSPGRSSQPRTRRYPWSGAGSSEPLEARVAHGDRHDVTGGRCEPRQACGMGWSNVTSMRPVAGRHGYRRCLPRPTKGRCHRSPPSTGLPMPPTPAMTERKSGWSWCEVS